MKVSLTYQLPEKNIAPFYLEVLSYYGLAAKNIRNSCLFIINNLFSSYAYDKNTKSYIQLEKLHSNQIEIINSINSVIITLNQKYTDKNLMRESNQNHGSDNAKDNNKESKKIKSFNNYGKTIDKNTYYQILDKTLLENVIKFKEQNSNTKNLLEIALPPDKCVNTINNYKDFTSVHSKLAQSVLHQLCDDFQYYFKALRVYQKNKDGFTGKPQPPQYKSKNASQTVELSAQSFTNKGQILKIGKKHQLYKDFDKKYPVLKDLSIPFNDFNLLKLIQEDALKRNIHSNVEHKIVAVRIVASTHKKLPKIQYVVSYEKELKGFYPQLIEKSLALKGQDFFDLKDKDRLDIIDKYFNQDYKNDNSTNNGVNSNIKNIPHFMAVDCGVVNFATVAYFTAGRDTNLVVSGRILKHKIGNIDSKIDKRKSELSTLDIRELQGKKDRAETLTRHELQQLKSHYKSLSADSKLVDYQTRKSNITMDFIHRLSKSFVDDCLAKNIQMIIVGKNKGWKQEINLGYKNNRAMYNFPHAKFIEILKYKAMLKDILVIETEESYTSKTSFIDNEELSIYTKKTTQDIKNQLLGRRVNRVFITKDNKKLHADVNGGFNIARKILKYFCYDNKKIVLNYNLVELSARGKKYYNFKQYKKL